MALGIGEIGDGAGALHVGLAGHEVEVGGARGGRCGVGGGGELSGEEEGEEREGEGAAAHGVCVAGRGEEGNAASPFWGAVKPGE